MSRPEVLPDLEALAGVVIETVEAALSPFSRRLAALEASAGALDTKAANLEHIRGDLEWIRGTLREELTAIRERVAVVEHRAPEPGPPGPAGRDGQDGKDGQDGAPGRDGKDGAPGKSFGDCYKGVYTAGQAYAFGDTVTYSGSLWFCQHDTGASPSEHGGAWRLMAKRGRDGRDLREAGRG
jgi:hypothetical protein